MALLLAAAAATAVHATFGRKDALSLCRRWAMRRSLSADSAASLARLRLAMEHPSSFLITCLDDPRHRAAFACLPDGDGVHRVEAVWTDGRGGPAFRLRALRRWHADAFPDHQLTPGPRLSEDERTAWGVM